MTPAETLRWTRVGMLAALALLLAYAETFVAIPIPGVKLGLANIPVLMALARGDLSGAFCVASIKVLATGLLFGSPLTLAYSLVGSLLSFVGMAPLSRLRTMRLWMVSVVGALLHETGQLLVASAVLGTGAVWYVTPALFYAGCATGLVSGLVAQQLLKALPPQDDLAAPIASRAVALPHSPSPQAAASMLVLCAFAVVVFQLEGLGPLGAAVAVALVTCLAVGVSGGSLLRVVRLTLAVGAFTLVLQLVLAPADAVVEASRAALRLAGIAWAALASMQLFSTDDLAGTVAWLVLPLSRLGVQTDGFVLAFSVAVDALPTLLELVQRHATKRGGWWSLSSLRDELPALVREFYARMGCST